MERLIDLGLARLLDGDEVSGAPQEQGLVELTGSGLALVAAQQGLSLGVAVRLNGLAGAGSDRPAGARRQLLRHLRHTLGADAVFVSLHRIPDRGAGMSGELVEWRNAVACSVGHVRPGRVRHLAAGGRLVRLLPGIRPGHDERARLSREVRRVL